MSDGGDRSLISMRVIDFVALREHLVEIHRADHGADIGQRQVGNRTIEVLDFIGRARGVDDLDERDRVRGHLRVVLRDHFLAWNVEHRFHHRHLASDAVEQRIDEGKPGLERARVATKLLNRPLVALWNELDRAKHENDCSHKEKRHKRRPEVIKHGNPLLLKWPLSRK